MCAETEIQLKPKGSIVATAWSSFANGMPRFVASHAHVHFVVRRGPHAGVPAPSLAGSS
jgi:hypothetical protein